MNLQEQRPKNILILDEAGALGSSQQRPERLLEDSKNESSNIRIIDDCGEEEASLEQSKSSDRNDSYRNEWCTARATVQRGGLDASGQALGAEVSTLHTERQKPGVQASFANLNSTNDQTADGSRDQQKPVDSSRSMLLNEPSHL